MKYYSEELKKFFDDPFDLERAEETFKKEKEAAEAHRKEQEEATSAKKKRLAKEIEEADVVLEKAYANLKSAKEECQKILEESNNEMETILNSAKAEVRKAEDMKYKAVKAFNDEFGVFKVSYTGDKALKELNRILDVFPSSFFRF